MTKWKRSKEKTPIYKT